MSTAFGFTTLTDAVGVTVCCRSLGAHLAAKLESFSSDERTLTDELCDMLCIWLKHSPPAGPPFVIHLKKTTAKQETKNGADLRLVIKSPEGLKDCLFQAKVLDPTTGKLRCATPGGYASLRKQLIKARNTCGDLAFLLVYVPSQHLDGAQHGYFSWEQGFCASSTPGQSSMYGATAIPVNSLLDNANAWIDPVNKVPHLTGVFPNGSAFSDVLLELLVCFRGQWRKMGQDEPRRDARPHNFLTLDIKITPETSWESIRESAAQALRRET